MGRYKCAYNCENYGDPDMKYFKFPMYNPRKLKKWLVNMKWKDWTPSRFSVLCMNHFEDQYIDRTGKIVKLREDAVPTIFASSDETHKIRTSCQSESTQDKTQSAEASQITTPSESPTNPPTTARRNLQNQEISPTEDEPAGNKDPKKPDKWRIIVDEGLMKIESFPYFFHGDYCLSQGIQWAPDDNFSTECKDPENVIEVAKHIVDIIAHFGYPLRVLSRLPHDIVQKINRELKDQLKITIALVVYHRQTGTADLVTQRLIDRIVSDLIEEHAADWDCCAAEDWSPSTLPEDLIILIPGSKRVLLWSDRHLRCIWSVEVEIKRLPQQTRKEDFFLVTEAL
ncbi:hypothetical protein Q5P01_016961 [Channa striata]|uniref:THAP domain-containing protein 1 n=1 Tax=Channa striata TaxID=64152 RepID=A0AA88MBC6_CHASR|nr:hypothetical protein Q5P01_016961 [Channa striata]